MKAGITGGFIRSRPASRGAGMCLLDNTSPLSNVVAAIVAVRVLASVDSSAG